MWRTNSAVASTLLAPVRLGKETLNGRLSGVTAQLASSRIDGGVPAERRARASSTRSFMAGQGVGVWAAGNRSSCHDSTGSSGWGGGVCIDPDTTTGAAIGSWLSPADLVVAAAPVATVAAFWEVKVPSILDMLSADSEVVAASDSEVAVSTD